MKKFISIILLAFLSSCSVNTNNDEELLERISVLENKIAELESSISDNDVIVNNLDQNRSDKSDDFYHQLEVVISKLKNNYQVTRDELDLIVEGYFRQEVSLEEMPEYNEMRSPDTFFVAGEKDVLLYAREYVEFSVLSDLPYWLAKMHDVKQFIYNEEIQEGSQVHTLLLGGNSHFSNPEWWDWYILLEDEVPGFFDLKSGYNLIVNEGQLILYINPGEESYEYYISSLFNTESESTIPVYTYYIGNSGVVSPPNKVLYNKEIIPDIFSVITPPTDKPYVEESTSISDNDTNDEKNIEYYGNYIIVYPNDSDAFNFPYIIFNPVSQKNVSEYIVVESYNTGANGTSNILENHINEAIQYGLGDYRLPQYVANSLNAYRVMPIIPRYAFYNPTTSEAGHSHGLDRDTLFIADNIDNIQVMSQFGNLTKSELLELDNIESQTYSIIQDAQSYLKNQGKQINDKILIAGFSAAGTFAQRFTSFYPEIVLALFSGGNHVPFIPSSTYGGENLIYPLGSFDHEYLTNSEFRADEYKNTPKLLYLGGLDSNDPFPNNDAFSPDERAVALSLYGDDYLSRWNNVQNATFDVGDNAIFVTSRFLEHSYSNELMNMVLDYFKSVINQTTFDATSYISSELIVNTGDGNQLSLPERDEILSNKMDGMVLVIGSKEPAELVQSKYSAYITSYTLSSANYISESDLNSAEVQIYLLEGTNPLNNYPQFIKDRIEELNKIEYETYISFIESNSRIIIVRSNTDILDIVETLPMDIMKTDY